MPKPTKTMELAARVPGFFALAPHSAAKASGLTRNGAEVAWLRGEDGWLVGLLDPASSEVRKTAPARPGAFMTYGGGSCGREIIRNSRTARCHLAPHPAFLPCRATSVMPESPNEKLVGSGVPKR